MKHDMDAMVPHVFYEAVPQGFRRHEQIEEMIGLLAMGGDDRHLYSPGFSPRCQTRPVAFPQAAAFLEYLFKAF